MEEIIEQEKKYLVEVLGKKLIDCNERDDRSKGYRQLAKKYWPEEYLDGTRKEVHHIDFDKSNNVVSNLVVLTPSNHKHIHYMFDPKYKETKKKIGERSKVSQKSHSAPWNKGKKGAQSGPIKGKHRVYNSDGTHHYE